MMTILHPPKRGPESLITIPLLCLGGTGPHDHDENDEKCGSNDDGIDNPKDGGENGTCQSIDGSIIPTEQPPQAQQHNHHGGVAGRFASRLMDNVQKHLSTNESITGTLTMSLECLQGDEEDDILTGEKKVIRLREPAAPRKPKGYAETKFRIAEDAPATRRRREKEGIKVPRMLSKVQALHDGLEGNTAPFQKLSCEFSREAMRSYDKSNPGKIHVENLLFFKTISFRDISSPSGIVRLSSRRSRTNTSCAIPGVHTGSVLTGAAATKLSTMTDGAVAVIPEVLAGQVLSLARRGGGGHTVLAASGTDQARDRLVVLLQPTLVEADIGERNGAFLKKQEVEGNCQSGVIGADERSKHALVVSCIPGQVKVTNFFSTLYFHDFISSLNPS